MALVLCNHRIRVHGPNCLLQIRKTRLQKVSSNVHVNIQLWKVTLALHNLTALANLVASSSPVLARCAICSFQNEGGRVETQEESVNYIRVGWQANLRSRSHNQSFRRVR